MPATKRTICVVTGTRAEYGLLYRLLHEIKQDEDLTLQIVVTGMHLSPEFGLTYKLIEQDGFRIDAKVEMLLSSDSPVGIAKSIGLGVIGFADALDRLKPDILVVLGDRFEILAAVQAALVARIPVAHIHGGEATEGLIDEPIRHAITKMAHIHFATADEYAQRIIQLGEQPDRVFNVGAPGIDNIRHIHLLGKEKLEQSLQFSLPSPVFLVTYHPVTLSSSGALEPMEQMLLAFQSFPTARIIFTKSNSDTDGRIINQLIDEYVSCHADKCIAFTSMGQLRYLSTMKYADVVIGNSSSGIIEAPFFRKPTVNIGERQRGRLRAQSVIDCDEKADTIVNAIHKALSPEFIASLATMRSPYGDGESAHLMKNILKTFSLDNIIMKRFFDCAVPSISREKR